MRKLALIVVLGLAGCAALTGAFTKNPETGKTPADDFVAAVAPFLGPWGTLAAMAVSAIGGGVTVHSHHKRKQKRAAAAAVAGAPAAKV